MPDDLLRLLNKDFELSILLNIDDLDAWLKEHAQGIEYAVTNGHDGLALPLMVSLPNLKLITCYGVGYGGINVKAAVERGILSATRPTFSITRLPQRPSFSCWRAIEIFWQLINMYPLTLGRKTVLHRFLAPLMDKRLGFQGWGDWKGRCPKAQCIWSRYFLSRTQPAGCGLPLL